MHSEGLLDNLHFKKYSFFGAYDLSIQQHFLFVCLFVCSLSVFRPTREFFTHVVDWFIYRTVKPVKFDTCVIRFIVFSIINFHSPLSICYIFAVCNQTPSIHRPVGRHFQRGFVNTHRESRTLRQGVWGSWATPRTSGVFGAKSFNLAIPMHFIQTYGKSCFSKFKFYNN